MPVFEVDVAAPPITAVRFSNGSINKKDVAVDTYVKREGSDTDSAREHILTAHVDGTSYVGKNFGPTNRFPTDTCDYYVGLHDESTGKIRVVPASLIQLEPWFKEKEDSSSLTFNSKTFKEKSDTLTTEFGSGRSQKAVNKRVRDKLDQGMVEMTAEALVNSATVGADDYQTPETQSAAIPPYNADAKTPDEVYMLKDIISREVLRSLTETSSALTSFTDTDLATWKKDKKYFSFILEKLGSLSDSPPARLLQGQCLMYLQYLMELYHMKAHQLRQKYPLPREWPEPVRDCMLNLFTLEVKEPGKPFRRCVPGRMKDLLLSHILVLCLKMSDYCLDISHLMLDLKHAAKKLTTHASSLGCITKKTKQGGKEVFAVILKVPLTFPKLKGKTEKSRIF